MSRAFICLHSGHNFQVLAGLFLAVMLSPTHAVSDDQRKSDSHPTGHGGGGEIGPIQEGTVFLEASRAKAMLHKRSKRGWWLGENEEENEEAEGRRENNNRLDQHRTCSATCWGSWSSWTSCSARCGNNGLKRSTRSRQPTSNCKAWVNSHGCPGQSRKSYPCNRMCNNGGTPTTNRCLCKPGFRGTCCEQRVTCSYPGKPAYGSATPHRSSYNVNNVVTFGCNTGYRRSGAANTKCLTTGRWSASKPTCTIVSCPDPGTPSNGGRTLSGTTYGKTVVYRCNTGYKLSGSTSRTCQASGAWSGSAASCQAVTCARLPSPSGGSVNQPGTPTYQSVAKFACSTGYVLQGSSQRTCQANGQWSGSTTSCKRITCSKPTAPANGKVALASGTHLNYGQRALYSCNAGYQLQGSNSRTCGGTSLQGTWSGSQPSCKAVSCGDPGAPSHGTRSGAYTYPSYVNFQCLPGYYLQGAARIQCNSNAKWSHAKPTCTACPKNQYKAGSNAMTSCSVCPVHAHTSSTASTNVKQCLCDAGYRGSPGGPCTQVRCPALQPPQNGRISGCHTTVDGACTFDCNNGYIHASGDLTRTCKQNGQWSGSQAKCNACPKDTYKASASQCTACPPNSRTAGPASMKTDCKCNSGYSGPNGGPCADVNECSSGKGGCEQECKNTVGSYTCVCNIPGFTTDLQDAKKCLETKKCSAFPQPDNGGSVCNRIWVTNTRRCQVKCNPGYDHLATPNPWELCGPDTNWQWSFTVAGREITACVEEYFPGVRTEADVFYFDDQCKSLTAAQKQQLRQGFIQMLRDQGVCRHGNQDICDIDNVRINCGQVDEFGDFDFGDFKRKKRSTNTETGTVLGRYVLDIKFDIKVKEKSIKTVDCGKYCKNTPVNGSTCQNTCKTKYAEEALNSVKSASTKLQNIFKNNVRVAEPTAPPAVRPSGRPGIHAKMIPVRPEARPRPGKAVTAPATLVLKIGGRSLFPASRNVKVKAAKDMDCPSGTVQKESVCAVCPAGTQARGKECQPCPVGTHQPRERQTRCLPCPPRAVAPRPGSKTCIIPA